jgi:Sulfite exporter TauE/SafE
MDQAMRLPFKVSTTTSNLMIGVTATASAGVYLNRGYIDPGLAMPVMLGVLGGALTGARVLSRAQTHTLRVVFSLVIFALALEMIYNGRDPRRWTRRTKTRKARGVGVGRGPISNPSRPTPDGDRLALRAVLSSRRLSLGSSSWSSPQSHLAPAEGRVPLIRRWR